MGRPTYDSSSQKTRLNDLSYGVRIWTDLSSALSREIIIVRPRLHSMQRGENLPVITDNPYPRLYRFVIIIFF